TNPQLLCKSIRPIIFFTSQPAEELKHSRSTKPPGNLRPSRDRHLRLLSTNRGRLSLPLTIPSCCCCRRTVRVRPLAPPPSTASALTKSPARSRLLQVHLSAAVTAAASPRQGRLEFHFPTT